MAKVCEFNGIKIAVHSNDHPPSHFHVAYAGQRAKYTVANPRLIRGSLPRNVERSVIEWARRRQTELNEAWNQAQQHVHIDEIAP